MPILFELALSQIPRRKRQVLQSGLSGLTGMRSRFAAHFSPEQNNEETCSRFADLDSFRLHCPGPSGGHKNWRRAGSLRQLIEALIPEAKAKGIEIKTVEFTDWTTPNIALQAGDVDLNYFQHRPFLDNAIAARGYELTDIGTGILANIGLYSLKHKDFASIPEGGTVGIASDPINQGRGLLLLQKAGLIKLRDGVGFKGTLDDTFITRRNSNFAKWKARNSCASRLMWISPWDIRTSSWPRSLRRRLRPSLFRYRRQAVLNRLRRAQGSGE